MNTAKIESVPGLVLYQITDPNDLDQWKKLNKELNSSSLKESKHESEKQKDQIRFRQDSFQKRTAHSKIQEQPPAKSKRADSRFQEGSMIRGAVVDPNEYEFASEKEELIEKQLRKFNYSQFHKELQQINEENSNQILEGINLQLQRIQQNLRKVSMSASKEKKNQFEEEKRRVKDLQRVKRLYQDKISMKEHVQRQHKVIMQIAKEYLDYKTLINNKVNQIQSIVRDMPTQNDKLRQIAIQNQLLKQERDRQCMLRMQIEQNIAKNQHNFHSLYNEVLEAKSIIHQQVRELMGKRNEHTEWQEQKGGQGGLNGAVQFTISKLIL